MKAITLTQPWATLVALGHKRIETRSWKTSYRGPLAIHAAKGFPGSAMSKCNLPFFYGRLHSSGILVELPKGSVVATCNLVDCVRTEELSVYSPWALTEEERAFGDYFRGRWAWILDEVKPLPAPVPAKGKLSLWEWSEGVES